jgi:heme A synthase
MRPGVLLFLVVVIYAAHRTTVHQLRKPAPTTTAGRWWESLELLLCIIGAVAGMWVAKQF